MRRCRRSPPCFPLPESPNGSIASWPCSPTWISRWPRMKRWESSGRTVRKNDAVERAGRGVRALGRLDHVRRARRLATSMRRRAAASASRSSHQVPRPFSDMTVFENVFVAAVERRRLHAFARLPTAASSAPAVRHARYRKPAGGKRSACSTASGSNSRARSRPIRSCCCSTRSAAASRTPKRANWYRSSASCAGAASRSCGSNTSCTCCCRSSSD